MHCMRRHLLPQKNFCLIQFVGGHYSDAWTRARRYRPIIAAEARCEAFLAINHGATGLLWFDWGAQGFTPQNTSKSYMIDEMPDVWAELRSVATEVTGLARAIAAGTQPPFAEQVSATGADSRKAEGGGSYSTWTAVDIQLWQNETTLLIVAVSTCPRPLSTVVIDLAALTQTLLRPNATARVDVGRSVFVNATAGAAATLAGDAATGSSSRGGGGGGGDGEYEVKMVDWVIKDSVGFKTGYAAHHYQIAL